MCPWLLWSARGCWVDLFPVAFGLAKLRFWATALNMWKTLQHVQWKHKIPTAGQQCPNVNCISEVACRHNDFHSAPEEPIHHKSLLMCPGCLEASRPCVVCSFFFADSSFSRVTFKTSPSSLASAPRPQKKWVLWLKLEKVIKRKSRKQKTTSRFLFTPLFG